MKWLAHFWGTWEFPLSSDNMWQPSKSDMETDKNLKCISCRFQSNWLYYIHSRLSQSLLLQQPLTPTPKEMACFGIPNYKIIIGVKWMLNIKCQQFHEWNASTKSSKWAVTITIWCGQSLKCRIIFRINNIVTYRHSQLLIKSIMGYFANIYYKSPLQIITTMEIATRQQSGCCGVRLGVIWGSQPNTAVIERPLLSICSLSRAFNCFHFIIAPPPPSFVNLWPFRHDTISSFLQCYILPSLQDKAQIATDTYTYCC